MNELIKELLCEAGGTVMIGDHGVDFPISQVFDLDTQGQRAERFAEYLNRLDEAARKAAEQIHLLDILSR